MALCLAGPRNEHTPKPPYFNPPSLGKQVGMSGVCYPDSLIGSIPNLYYYAANNPSEATIAKRRSYANTISYLTPPAENAGLYKVGCVLGRVDAGGGGGKVYGCV